MRNSWVLVIALLVAAPALAGEGLLERNRAVLLAMLPADAVLEVQVHDAGGLRTEAWTAAAFADFRAGAAARMGRDYAAAPENVPDCRVFAGAHDCRRLMAWSVQADLWGSARVNTGAGGVADAEGAWDHRGCFGALCSAVMGTPISGFFRQVCYSHHQGQGTFIVFGAPFGGVFFYQGWAIAEPLGSAHAGGCA